MRWSETRHGSSVVGFCFFRECSSRPGPAPWVHHPCGCPGPTFQRAPTGLGLVPCLMLCRHYLEIVFFLNRSLEFLFRIGPIYVLCPTQTHWLAFWRSAGCCTISLSEEQRLKVTDKAKGLLRIVSLYEIRSSKNPNSFPQPFRPHLI